MNKYNLKEFLSKELEEHRTTLKAASYDDENQQYLCNDSTTSNVYSFDEYVEKNFDPTQLPASPDAIFIGDKKLYFVEFKNSLPKNIDSKNMKDKFEKGTEVLKKLLQAFIPRDIDYIFCVVHKKQTARYFNPAHIQSNTTRFGLAEKNAELGGFYSNIITEDIDFYKSVFKELKC